MNEQRMSQKLLGYGSDIILLIIFVIGESMTNKYIDNTCIQLKNIIEYRCVSINVFMEVL